MIFIVFSANKTHTHNNKSLVNLPAKNQLWYSAVVLVLQCTWGEQDQHPPVGRWKERGRRTERGGGGGGGG